MTGDVLCLVFGPPYSSFWTIFSLFWDACRHRLGENGIDHCSLLALLLDVSVACMKILLHFSSLSHLTIRWVEAPVLCSSLTDPADALWQEIEGNHIRVGYTRYEAVLRLIPVIATASAAAGVKDMVRPAARALKGDPCLYTGRKLQFVLLAERFLICLCVSLSCSAPESFDAEQRKRTRQT